MEEDFLNKNSQKISDKSYLADNSPEKEATTEKKRLLQVLSYKKEIEPYGIIEILAGTGSGKNFFINKVASGVKQGEDGALEDIEKKTVLLITSRRAKADEVRKDKSVTMVSSVDAWNNEWALDSIEDIDEYLESARKIEVPDSIGEWGQWGTSLTIYQASTAWTNAAVECYLKGHYSPTNFSSHLWQRFDLIVLDEAHSVRADASYQSSPFYVQALVNEAYHRYRSGESKCKVIIMTGSPKIISDFSFPNGGNRINKMEECRNTIPKRITFVTKLQAKAIMNKRLERGERVVYFFNHIGDILSTAKEYKNTSLHEQMAVSFSDIKRRDKLKKADAGLYVRMDEAEKAISTTQKLPDSIKLFLTTGKNKEGINIKDTDIAALFVEAHAEVDIVQMAGRIREGVDDLYIVTDSQPHESKESSFEYQLTSKKDFLKVINDHLEALCKVDQVDLHDLSKSRKPAHKYPHIGAYIDYIHEKFPYIRYDYFKDKFVLYVQRKHSIEYFKSQLEIFDRCLSSPDELERLANSWFPNVPVTVLSNVQERIDEYLKNNQWLNEGRVIQGDERDEILRAINGISAEGAKQLKTLLGKYGYSLETDGNKRTSRSTITKIQEAEGGTFLK